MDRIVIEDFPEELQELFTVNPTTVYFRQEVVPNTETEGLKLVLETLMLTDKSGDFEPIRKRVIREEIKNRKSREVNLGKDLLDEWNQVTEELRAKFKRGAYWK